MVDSHPLFGPFRVEWSILHAVGGADLGKHPALAIKIDHSAVQRPKKR
jgi:hypothetical protein